MKIWYFHGQYKANGLGTNGIYIFDLSHLSKVGKSSYINSSIQRKKQEKYSKRKLQSHI